MAPLTREEMQHKVNFELHNSWEGKVVVGGECGNVRHVVSVCVHITSRAMAIHGGYVDSRYGYIVCFRKDDMSSKRTMMSDSEG